MGNTDLLSLIQNFLKLALGHRYHIIHQGNQAKLGPHICLSSQMKKASGLQAPAADIYLSYGTAEQLIDLRNWYATGRKGPIYFLVGSFVVKYRHVLYNLMHLRVICTTFSCVSMNEGE